MLTSLIEALRRTSSAAGRLGEATLFGVGLAIGAELFNQVKSLLASWLQ